MTIQMIVDECDKYELQDIVKFVFYDPMQFGYTESQSTTSTFRSGI
jgi:hypothetical protein